MTTFTLLTVALGILGTVAATVGISRIVRDPRRISAYAYSLAGLGAGLLSLWFVLYLEADWPQLLIGSGVTAVGVRLVGNLLGYPALVVCLLWAAITTVRLERRSLASERATLDGV